jgi:hypothetical protein
VERVQPGSGEDIAVLLLGYTKEMTDMLRDCNPGLARRFPVSSAFVFDAHFFIDGLNQLQSGVCV